MNVGYYQTASGRQPAGEFIGSLPQKFRAQIRADIDAVVLHGPKAPVSMKPVTAYSSMWEIRTGNYRTFYYFAQDMVVVLHCCKKEDQDHGIRVAYKRMKELMEG